MSAVHISTLKVESTLKVLITNEIFQVFLAGLAILVCPLFIKYTLLERVRKKEHHSAVRLLRTVPYCQFLCNKSMYYIKYDTEI